MAGDNTSASFVPGSTGWFARSGIRCVRTSQMRHNRCTSGRDRDILGSGGGLRGAKITLDLLLQTS
eukprot:6076470-Amphidinium_carterae.1